MNQPVFRYGFLAVLLLFTAFMTISAQEFRGSVTGTVTDPNGAVVPGATVLFMTVRLG